MNWNPFKRKPKIVIVSPRRKSVDCSIRNKIHRQLAKELGRNPAPTNGIPREAK